MSTVDTSVVAEVFQAESGRCIATLTRLLGDLETAEDAVQEAFARALVVWSRDGLPERPGAWITTTARNHAIDGVRRAARGRPLETQVAHGHQPAVPTGDPAELAVQEVGPVDDDQLRLLFSCCHPALSMQARVALTLRLLGGLTTAEIARLFLVTDDAMSARLTRAKHKIRDAVVPYRVPGSEDLQPRLAGVLAVVYLLHTTGVDLSLGDARGDLLVAEARRLARLLVALLPDEQEAAGLLSLLLLSGSRRPARHDADGALVLLRDQDRTSWDRTLRDEGLAVLEGCLARDRLGPYQLQAAIQAVHARAPDIESTRWDEVVGWYDRLLGIGPSPVVALNRAVAVAEVEGASVGLTIVEQLHSSLQGFQPFHAVRAELRRRTNDRAGAAADYRRAIELAPAPAVADHLRATLDDLGDVWRATD